MMVDDSPPVAAAAVLGAPRPAPHRQRRTAWLSFPSVAAAAVLFVLVGAPLLAIITTSLGIGSPGGPTLDHFVVAQGSARYLRAEFNTLLLGLTVAGGTVLIGVPLAWAVARTDMGAKQFVRNTAALAFICPPYLAAVGWILIAGPNAGLINRVAAGTLGGGGIVNIFSFTGMAFVMSASLFFFVFSFTSSALDNVPAEMEEAATILGAGNLRTAIYVTLPLIAPALIGAVIIVFLQTIALYGVPALLAYPARFPVLVTALLEFFEVPVQVGAAAAYTVPLLIVTAIMQWLQKRLTQRRGFVTITGKGGRHQLLRLRRARLPITAAAVLVCVGIVVLPLVVLLQAALSRAWGQGFSAGNVTFDNFVRLVQLPGLRQALVNSAMFAGASALLTAIVAFAVSYIVLRLKVAIGPLLSFLAMAPYAIPGIVLAIGFYAAFAAPPLSLYGTGLLIVLAFTSRFLPITYSSSVASLASLNPELEDAAAILGASRLSILLYITWPSVRRSLGAAGILVFILASHELSTAVFLVGPTTRVVSISMIELADNGQIEALAAMGIALMTLTLGCVWLGTRLVGRGFMSGQTEP